MTDRAFETPEADPFAQVLGGPGGDDDDPFKDVFASKPRPEDVSSFGAFRRGAARSALPALGSIPAMGAGAELGAAVGSPLGPIGAGAGAIIGGLGGAIAGASAVEAAQRWAVSKLPDTWQDALGMSDRQEKLDQEQAPKASFLGGLAPYAITMRPSGFSRKALPENSTALERIMAHPATARVFGAGVMGGMELGQEAVQGERPDWTKVAISTGFGLVFNKPTRIGEAISEIGARPVRRALGIPERAALADTTRAEPTVADAADLGVMGPGHTEATFHGAHEPDPAAVEAARETKRTEQSVIGPDPVPPDVHSVARQMHFDLFTEYDALRDRRRALEAEPGAADHLAATEARLAKLEKEVQAANRRAAEATGQPIHEGPVEAPIAPDIETQRATIAHDVGQQLVRAGRPPEEAAAAAQLIAARYIARAGAFKGALGTPEELYRREGAEIRAMEIRRKVRTPAAARALDDFQQRMATGKEQAQKRRNEGGGAVRVMTTAEKYAGVTEEEFNAAQRDAVEAAPELKALLTDDDWKFMASSEFYQRRTAPSGPNLFTQREGEGQTNLPGTERISEADLAKRRAAEPMKPGVAQKPMDIGLFSDEAKQGSLFQGKEPRVVSSKAMQKQILQNEWAKHGRDLDYDDIWQTEAGDQLWDKEVRDWNAAHGTNMDPSSMNMGLSGPNGEFLRYFEQKHMEGKKAPFPGVKKANEYFELDGDPEGHAAYLSKDEAPLYQHALGSFLPRGEGRPGLIKLARDANASTFIHESGHDFLEQMMRDDAHPLAPADLKADAQTIRDWLGIKEHQDLNTGWSGERGKAVRRAHEKFARGFEQYLREGVAPSQALARVFAQFKQWLTQIYQTLRGLGEPINPDIRAVFDRMLTSEPQRTVIAPERDLPRSLADIHEADADFYAGHEMEGVGDRIAAEADRAYDESPHAPSLETKITAAEAVEPAGEARPGGPEGGTVQPGGGIAGPDAGRGGAGSVAEAERAGRAEGVPESAGAREREPEAGRERADAVPLAGRPAPDLTIGGQSFNVGKKGDVRAENISSREQFVAAINESSERIPGGGPLTMGEMQGLADDLALDPKTLDEGRLASLFGGIQNLSSKIYALRQTIKAQSETVFNAMRAVQETGTDRATMAFALEAGRLDMMMSVLSSVTTEVGRGLGMSFKNLEGWKKATDLNEFLKANTGKTLFQLKMVAKLGAQLDSPAKVAKYLRDAGKRSFGGMLLEYWINGLISGIATHSTYAVGNTILTVEKMGPETAAAAMIGAARKAMGRQGETVRLGEVGAHFAGAARNLPGAVQAGIEGLRTGMTTLLPGEAARPLIPFAGDTSLVTARTIGNQPVSWGEVGADLFGLVRGMRDGVVSTAALIRAGGHVGAPLIGASYSPLGQIPDIAYRGVPVIPVGSAIRVPGRFIAAIHSFFRTTNYSIYKSGGAYRTATSEGLNGTAFDARVADIHQNPPEAMMEAWRNEATETALMGHVGKFGQALSNLTNVEFNLPVLGGVRLLKFIDPFVHISSNVLKQTVMLRTPAGLLSAELRADLAGTNGTVAQDTAMARMLVGSALSITFGGLAAEGFITGSGPSDPHEAAMWREVYQPHSVRIGDMWYQVNRLGPIGMLLGIAADLYEVAHDATEGDVIKAAAHLQHAITQNILDESFMRGPADLIKAVEDPGRYGEGYVKNFASSFVPFSVGMSQMARAADPYSRQARNVMDSVLAKIPGRSQELFPRINIWGEPVPNLPALGGRAISALYEKQVNSDPVNQAMLDLGIHPAAVERKIRNVELTDQQYDDFARIAGRMAKQRLDMIVRAPDWQTWPNHIRHDVFAEVIRQSREGARGITVMKYPTIPRDAAEALRKKKMGEK